MSLIYYVNKTNILSSTSCINVAFMLRQCLKKLFDQLAVSQGVITFWIQLRLIFVFM